MVVLISHGMCILDSVYKTIFYDIFRTRNRRIINLRTLVNMHSFMNVVYITYCESEVASDKSLDYGQTLQNTIFNKPGGITLLNT